MRKTKDALASQIQNIYKQFGYSQFKMNKFEEYDVYVNNKDFLISDKVITFTDTNGKLLALKPDVTISIIRNFDESKAISKTFYTENVYRISDGTNSFKEIMQSGLECIGDIDEYSISEVIILAAKSLECIDQNYMLDISHMGLISSLLNFLNLNGGQAQKFLTAIGEKNLPELSSLCKEYNLDTESTNLLRQLVTTYGPIAKVCDSLCAFCVNDETKSFVNELISIKELLESINLSEKVQIDFSVVNDMNYYNGIVFKGYISSVPAGILSGGQYDRLVRKIGKNAKGLGFAIYLDMLEVLFNDDKEYDADVCLLYNKTTSPKDVLCKMNEIIKSGKTVLAINSESSKIYCKEKISL